MPDSQGGCKITMPSHPKDNIDRLIQAEIAKDPTISEGRIAKNIGVARNTVADHLKKLIAAGRVLPKGYYLAPETKPRRKIIKYIFIEHPTNLQQRQKTIKILDSNSKKFPYVRVTEPCDYIAFVPENTPGAETDHFTTQLINAGADTKTSVLTGDPPDGSPELPN
jgi:DNA-binding Lrp family transcriptional regulator